MPSQPPQPQPQPQQQQAFTVIILGSTLPALALALALAHQAIPFTLLTHADSLVPAASTARRPVALHPHGVAILDQLGVWEHQTLQDAAVAASGRWWDAVAQRCVLPACPLATPPRTHG